MICEEVLSWIAGIMILAAAILGARRKSARYGRYTDPVRIRVTPFAAREFRRKRPEDGLYDDEGRINRHWKP